jgi:hypothetical protein
MKTLKQNTMEKLNKNEMNVLTAIKNRIVDETGESFAEVQNIKCENISQNQLKGYLSILIQKKLCWICDYNEINTIYLTENGCNVLLESAQSEIEIKQINLIKINL